MRVAAIDCGTNSIRLLIAEPDGAGGMRELHRELQLVRLGQGVDATGEFSPAALERTLAAAQSYAEVITGFGVPASATRFVATSAARDARNRAEFFAGVRASLGVEAEVISGAEEARLSYAGALAGVGAVPEPVLVMDIGGGSTELVLGSGGVVDAAVSLDIGSVRLRERSMPSDPPGPAELAATAEFVDQQLDTSGIDLGTAATWIGVAGTVTSLAAIALGLDSYDRARIHRAEISLDLLRQAGRQIATSTVDGLVARGPVPRRRAEVLAAGVVILERVAGRVGAGALLVSESDILDGIAAGLLG